MTLYQFTLDEMEKSEELWYKAVKDEAYLYTLYQEDDF
jgi:hypothetical protein